MARDKVEQRLEALKPLRAAGPSAAGLDSLRKALQDQVNVVVAKAASIAAEWQTRALIPELEKAFDRLFEKPVKTDPQCWGKTAIAKALKDLGASEARIFLLGARHFQFEPTWGGRSDTAATLRGTCVLALVQCNDILRDEILRQLVESATESREDSAARVRADAIAALEQIGGPDVVLLLRLKARAGDREPAVSGRVLEALLQLEGSGAVLFVSEFVESANEDIAGEAALALGVSRLPEALAALQDYWKKSRLLGAHPSILRAISASRLDEAFQFLLDLVEQGRSREAEGALEALELHRDSPAIVARIHAAVTARGDAEITARFSARFALASDG